MPERHRAQQPMNSKNRSSLIPPMASSNLDCFKLTKSLAYSVRQYCHNVFGEYLLLLNLGRDWSRYSLQFSSNNAAAVLLLTVQLIYSAHRNYSVIKFCVLQFTTAVTSCINCPNTLYSVMYSAILSPQNRQRGFRNEGNSSLWRRYAYEQTELQTVLEI